MGVFILLIIISFRAYKCSRQKFYFIRGGIGQESGKLPTPLQSALFYKRGGFVQLFVYDISLQPIRKTEVHQHRSSIINPRANLRGVHEVSRPIVREIARFLPMLWDSDTFTSVCLAQDLDDLVTAVPTHKTVSSRRVWALIEA